MPENSAAAHAKVREIVSYKRELEGIEKGNGRRLACVVVY